LICFRLSLRHAPFHTYTPFLAVEVFFDYYTLSRYFIAIIFTHCTDVFFDYMVDIASVISMTLSSFTLLVIFAEVHDIRHAIDRLLSFRCHYLRHIRIEALFADFGFINIFFATPIAVLSLTSLMFADA